MTETSNLEKISRDIFKNLIFTDRHIGSEDKLLISSIFMPLIFGALSPSEEKTDSESDTIKPEDIGMIYEYNEKAGPRAINGYPVFASMRVLNKEQAEYVWNKVEKMEKALENVE